MKKENGKRGNGSSKGAGRPILEADLSRSGKFEIVLSGEVLDMEELVRRCPGDEPVFTVVAHALVRMSSLPELAPYMSEALRELGSDSPSVCFN